MATHLVLQASGAMFQTHNPQGWTFCFGVYVCDNDGNPVEGLQKRNFSVWSLTNAGQLTLNMLTDFNAELPTSKMTGIYRLQTSIALALGAPHPQEFVFAIRASVSKRPTTLKGFATVPITYLGASH